MGRAKDKGIIEYALNNNRIIVTGGHRFWRNTSLSKASRSNYFEVAEHIHYKRSKQKAEGVLEFC